MEKQTMRTIPKFVIPIAAVLVLLSALTTPALALGESYDYDGFPLTTKSHDTINGDVFISYGDNDQMENAKVKPYVTNYSVPNGTPKWAKLYMHLWGGNPHNGGTVNVTFNGHEFDTVVINGTSTDDPQVLGSGCGTWWLFFNVTSNITAGAINRAEASVTSTSMDGRVMRMVLIEVYEGGDDPQNVMYWVDDGHMNLHYNSSEHPWCIDYTKAWFNGTVPSGVTEANLTGVWLTGTYGEPDYFYFSPPEAPDAPNGGNINWNMSKYSDYQFCAYDSWTGDMSCNDVAMGGGWYNNYFDIHSNTTTNTSTLVDVLKTDNNYAIFWRGHDDNDDGWIYGAFGGAEDPEGEGYVHPVVAVLVLSLGPQAYTISGYTDPAADTVKITNLNESKGVEDRPADYIDLVTGFYNLTLNVPDEVETGDVLRIITCDVPDNYTSNCNVTDHTVVDIGGEENVNLTLNHYCQNYYPAFPFHTWEESNWSGPAVMEMMIDHYRDPPDVPNQTELNATGLGYNQGCNADLLFVDPLGMKSTLNLYLHAYNGLPYVANYGIGSYDELEDVLHYICKWHYLGPGTAPAYGNYSNWMVVRGIHTNTTPSFTQGSYEIYGFWINDPYNETLEGPGGIGENTYKTVDQWSSIYHKKLNESDVNTSDDYYDRYVAICEPPEDDDVEVTLALAKPRFADAITPVQMEKPLMVYEVEQLAFEKVVTNDESLKIVKAAIDGVTEELIPYDSEFAEAFAKTTAGAPMLVTADSGNYYVVPFNVPVEVRPPITIMPVKIEKVKISGLKELEQVKRVDDNVIIEPIQIEPIEVERTLVVVLVDATDGSFKEASWVADAVKYLPVSKIEALKLALSEIHITSASELNNLSSKPTIELVYGAASPYYPDWKITVDGSVFYVSQDGRVSS